MKSVREIAAFACALPLAADDIIEFHGARLLLLLHHCGSNGKIHGLTKLAKLDFFVRYPAFFERVAESLGRTIPVTTCEPESAMVRHHYGPWDKRYYQVLGFLRARGLIAVRKIGNAYEFSLTKTGEEKAKSLSRRGPFAPVVEHMGTVKKVLGRKSGAHLKDLVYRVFDAEVAQRKLGDVIR